MQRFYVEQNGAVWCVRDREILTPLGPMHGQPRIVQWFSGDLRAYDRAYELNNNTHAHASDDPRCSQCGKQPAAGDPPMCANCGTFTMGYVYGLLDTRINDIFYVGSTVQQPGVRYSDHMGARRSSNSREAWIMTILASGSFPVFFPLYELITDENEIILGQNLRVIEHAIADELRAIGHTALCDFYTLVPHTDIRMPVTSQSTVGSEVRWNLLENAIAEHLDRVNEQARIVRWLREI